MVRLNAAMIKSIVQNERLIKKYYIKQVETSENIRVVEKNALCSITITPHIHTTEDGPQPHYFDC